ncbi:MAG: acyltransferase, partial [Prevotellaceae bacterium]|nr:acyltransferase [Prevotellaceae bacterium]
MISPELLNDYRPYYDSEVPEAVQRIAEDALFEQIVKFVFPERDFAEFAENFKKISTVYQFQDEVMNKAIHRIVDMTMTNLSYSSVENLTNDKSYMYISNHRDIVLDSAILQIILFGSGIKTSEITFGSNLMRPQIVVDIGKINKMFKIVRGGTIREIFVNSLKVS